MTFFKTSAAAVLLAGAAAFAVSAATPQRVACVGNSITYGSLVENREQNAYPVQLGRMLGDKYVVDNFGRPGATLLFKGHNPYVKSPEFKAALAFKPDVIVVHLGVNDTDPRNWPDFNSEFVGNYIALVDSFRHVNPDVRVIIANLSPLTAKHHRFRTGTRDWRIEIRNTIETVAQVTGAELIDFAEPLLDHTNYLTDGIHPNAKGATLLAKAAYSAITGNYGGLKMPPVYGSGMVLQRYKPLVISGTADAGANVTVSIAGTTVKAVANNQGKWAVELPPMSECTGLVMKVTDGKQTLVFNDVAVGEVWLASGQSNMEFNLKHTTTYKADSALTTDPLLRLYDMKPRVITNNITWNEANLEALDSLNYYHPSSWQKSDYKTAGRFSAVAWYFGKMLRDSLDVPVGIINNAIGGSGTEAWIDIETLELGMPEALVNWRKNDYTQPWAQGRANKNTGDNLSYRHPYEPTYLYAAGIRPLGAYPIAGVIWYQGESNAHNIEVHEGLFRLLVDSWRKTWDSPQLPFIFTQLSSIDRPSWPQFRDSQRRLAKEIPGTAMAVSHDHGDSLDVHPRNKRPVGERLARQALNRVYSTGTTPSGPLPLKATLVAPGTVRLEMEYGRGMKTSDGAAPRTFEVAEVDGIYYPASAQFTADNIITLTNMDITNPRYVRYAWQPFTRANVVNSENLPASTFKIEITETPDSEEGIASGVSAAFAGTINGKVIKAGGCNFPVNPMAPGSVKKFYQAIYELVPQADGSIVSKKIGMLPEAIAYGASATVPQGIVCIGGTTAQKALSSVLLISLDENGNAVVSELPSLPVTVDNTSAAYLDGKVYVAGGNIAGAPSNALYVLDMNKLSAGWKELKSFPGNPRVQPVLAGSKDAKGKSHLYMWGGFAGKGENREASLNTDGLMYDPASGKWSALPDPVGTKGETVSTGGGIAVVLPDGRIVVTGGVNKDVFLEALRNQAPDYLSHPIEWYRFNDLALVFDPKAAKWSIGATDSEIARAGAAAAVTPDGEIWLIGGELKPRIRTPKVSKLKL
ncbi:MAG: cyclically-permuted mutarotase family protein [Paramuribaculum sp.]|nr:cyclically-permuted mutarotase family protein [Paramuribaculum sp.]